jgi:O-antigen ligase
VVALIGIIQKPLYHGALYGIWIPRNIGTPFGPFVNRNHFAGWTAMAIPLAIGSIAAAIDQARDYVRPSLSGWVAWMGSRAGSRVQHAALAALLMGLALALSLSRSGIVSLIAALTVCGIAGAKRRYHAVGRIAAVTSVVAATALIVAWASPDVLAARFAAPSTSTLSGRLPIWTLDVQMVRDFWTTGAGLNAYSTATLFYPEAVPGFHLREAHNDYLQLAIEGGLLVGVPIVVTVAAFVVAVRRRFRSTRGSFYWVRLGAVTGIVAIACQSLADFSLQMPGNAALFAALCGLALQEERPATG